MSKTGELLDRARAVPIRTPGPASLLMKQLRDLGWKTSVARRESVNAAGEPIPWWTYPATRWLALALAARTDVRVFEFGSGASTAWLAGRAASILSVEHVEGWAEKVRPTLPANADLRLIPTTATDADAEADDPYLAPLDGAFDLIVIDGMGRNACARRAVDHVTADGMILLDDADRVAYADAHAALDEAGFGRLDFFGLRPGVGHLSTTSLFCRDFGAWARGLRAPEVSGF